MRVGFRAWVKVGVLRMDIRHVELKIFGVALCSLIDKGRVSYFQRPGLRVGFRAWVRLGCSKFSMALNSSGDEGQSVISSGQVRGVGFRACQVEVLRMNFRHVEVK